MNGSSTFNWNEGLEGPHFNIANINHTPIRVMAGPGTGKTFALMRRVARLLQQGIDPSRILVCTFTRTAARDLAKELAGLGIDGVESVKAGTLHSLCFSILSQNATFNYTGRSPRPLLDFELRFLLQDLENRVYGRYRNRVERLNAFNSAWARLQNEEPGWPNDAIDRSFHIDLIAWLKFHGCMLIGELIPETLRFLLNNPYSSLLYKYDHVLVDEYQDLNKAEQKLLDLLSNSRNLLIIGDEDQSIYSFKYAHPEGISTFNHTHPGTHDESLFDCRRCPKKIVSVANHLIANNTNRMRQVLNPYVSNAEGEIYITQWNDIQEEADGIASFITESINSSQVAPGRVLVLSPRRQIGYEIKNALTNSGVQSHSFFHEEALQGNPRIIEDSLMQQSFTLLNILVNQNDIVSLRCWCGFGNNSLCRPGWKQIRIKSETTGETPWNVLTRLSNEQDYLPYTSNIIERFNTLNEELNSLRRLRGRELLEALFPSPHDYEVLFRNIVSQIDNEDYDASELRDALRIGITQPELPTDVDYVRIMSLHKSKGLSADLVVVAGCVEGLIPFIKGSTVIERDRLLEEQRRLFYVSITRTRKILLLSSFSWIKRDVAHQIGTRISGGNRDYGRTISSRFLNELGLP